MNNIIQLNYMEESIAIITMQDQVNKNMFSVELVKGLQETFKQVKENPVAKVIVLQGYENYFCCGGKKEDLLSLVAGKATFADTTIYRLLLDCPLPVIAAMQGHALGGGLAFSSFADIMILAEEAIYASNFLKYGFTPGFGATYIIPEKFGKTVGAEMLYTAEAYSGLELKQRNVPIPVVKKAAVFNYALKLAKQINEKPKLALQLLKAQLNQQLLQALPGYIDQELNMHAATLHTAEVRAKINDLLQ